MARCAIRLALEVCGYLHYKRRAIPPPLYRRKADSITDRAHGVELFVANVGDARAYPARTGRPPSGSHT